MNDSLITRLSTLMPQDEARCAVRVITEWLLPEEGSPPLGCEDFEWAAYRTRLKLRRRLLKELQQ
jgi:hypothetical protein